MMNIKKSIEQFQDEIGVNERYASFDYCYNYFYSFYKKNQISKLADNQNIQMSCLQIGFFMASWGMMRGSSFLLKKSVRNYSKLIDEISNMSYKLWEIDVGNYNENISLLLECKGQISSAFGDGNKPTDTLITKIMLGVFANIPAFDQFFRTSFGVRSFNEKSLLKIKNFYEENKDTFDSYKIPTLDFLTGKPTDVIYTKAKLIDMSGFIDGQEIIAKERLRKSGYQKSEYQGLI